MVKQKPVGLCEPQFPRRPSLSSLGAKCRNLRQSSGCSLIVIPKELMRTEKSCLHRLQLHQIGSG